MIPNSDFLELPVLRNGCKIKPVNSKFNESVGISENADFINFENNGNSPTR